VNERLLEVLAPEPLHLPQSAHPLLGPTLVARTRQRLVLKAIVGLIRPRSEIVYCSKHFFGETKEICDWVNVGSGKMSDLPTQMIVEE
jgi:hypothetical protein